MEMVDMSLGRRGRPARDQNQNAAVEQLLEHLRVAVARLNAVVEQSAPNQPEKDQR